MNVDVPRVAVIGAGIAGLASALRLAHAGLKVSVFERHSEPGGKMRTIPSVAGPVDAGPTVLTMKHVFEALFDDCGAKLSDHLTLEREMLLARHFWKDGTRLDLHADQAASEEEVARVFGQRSAQQFAAFSRRAASLFETFDGPIMQSPSPSLATVAGRVMCQPSILRHMAPHRNLQSLLRHLFDEPKLAQLFGRYATYVGGRPNASPALLSLIWHAEAQGVWHVKGGMHRLAQSIEGLARTRGADFHYGCHIDEVTPSDRPGALRLRYGGSSETFTAVVFNGDPNALRLGLLGSEVRHAIGPSQTEPRSLSAYVHSFAAKAEGLPLAAHNVFFGADPDSEFNPIGRGQLPVDPTLYICAQDRFSGGMPDAAERFEIIMNAPPVGEDKAISDKEVRTCQRTTFETLKAFGLTFTPEPGREALTTPQTFNAMFPASGGALYGRSPHGMMAAFQRPKARTKIKGLYLTGGGAHPGAGIPMATLSARHAAEAILKDLSLTSTYREADMLGGMSTVSAMTASKPSPSSAS